LTGDAAAKAVPTVQDFTFKQVGNGRNANMGVRAHVNAIPGRKMGRPHMIKKDPWPDHSPANYRQNPPYRKAPEVTVSGLKELNYGATFFGDGEIHFSVGREIAHGQLRT
tara:strand:+ start:20007 stop:20336 length:330 start_codon:yes stop_codon:yes gene_type:complete